MSKIKYLYTARLVREFSMEIEAVDEHAALSQGETFIEQQSVNAPCTQPDGKEVPWWWEFKSLVKVQNNG